MDLMTRVDDPLLTKPRPRAEEAAHGGTALLQAVPDFEKIDGWLKLSQAELLFAAAAAVRVGCIVEIGSYRGRSTAALCAGSNAGAKVPVYAIEPHEQFIGPKGGVFGANDRRSFFRTMLATKFTSIVRLVNTRSEVVAPGWDKPVSLLFIDGDHRYEAVLSDFINWLPHLIDGALVIFQDSSGAGPALVIKDYTAAGVLTPLRTAGPICVLRFNAVARPIAPLQDVETPTLTLLPSGTDGEAPANQTGFPTRYALYSPRGRYVYQPIPGCASHPVQTVLLDLEKAAAEDSPGLQRLDALPDATQDAIRQERGSIFNFVFVRDPYARIATLYRNKIEQAEMKGHTHWADQVRLAAKAAGIGLSDHITFPEFVQTISVHTPATAPWRPQFQEGGFATTRYDFTGRLEMISSDLALVLEQLGAPADIMHKAVQPRVNPGTNLALWSLIPADMRTAFLKQFEADFDVFRYPRRPASVLFMPVHQDGPDITFPPAMPVAPAGLPQASS